MQRQENPPNDCKATIEELKELLTEIDDCPDCLKLNVLCFVRNHPSRDLSQANLLLADITEAKSQANLLQTVISKIELPTDLLGTVISENQSLIKLLSSFHTEIEELRTSLFFNIGKEFADLKAIYVYDPIHIISSETCKFSQENITTFKRLLNGLFLPCDCNLKQFSEAVEETALERVECPWENLKSPWDSEIALESLSYQPLLEYLKNVAELKAFIVAGGEGLPLPFLFNVHAYSVRRGRSMSDKMLGKVVDEPRYRFNIEGCSDVVILYPDSLSISRVTICTAIEVKPVGFDENEGLREAFFQLMGLSVINHHSPSILLTNLTNIHYLLYLECIRKMPYQFKLIIKKFVYFNEALFTAMSIKDRDCFTGHFGDFQTPTISKIKLKSEKSDRIEVYGNCTLEMIE